MILRDFLRGSQATESFRDAVDRFLSTGQPNGGIVFDSRQPPVKVQRALTKILESYPEVAIERVEFDATSGCEFFRGIITIHSVEGERQVRFHWDCRWRAEQQGWTDFFGFPDQVRAAREFGYDCFRYWAEERVVPAS